MLNITPADTENWTHWPAGRLAAERPYWLAFTRLEAVGASRLAGLIQNFGSLEAAWKQATFRQLVEMPGFGPELAEQVLSLRQRVDPAGVEDTLIRGGTQVLLLPQPEYPECLRRSPGPPAVLFARGRFETGLFRRAVALVGTRQPSEEGLIMARLLARDLAGKGVTVVSGMALGIDGAAHQGALAAAQGVTVAVLGCGTDRVSPPSHRGLYTRILDRGAIVSEYPDGTSPLPGRFPVRNRIISGLCAGVVIIEAPRESGTMHTADYALEQGREVMVVPGSVLLESCAGSNRLLREGARPVTSAAEILEEVGWGELRSTRRNTLALLPEEEALLHLLKPGGTALESLVQQSGLAPAALAALVSGLEIKGAICRLPGGRYVPSH